MADDEHRFGLCRQVFFQPAGRVDVEMVARLVEEHDIGSSQQELGKHQPALLAAAEGLHRAIVVFGTRRPRPSSTRSTR